MKHSHLVGFLALHSITILAPRLLPFVNDFVILFCGNPGISASLSVGE